MRHGMAIVRERQFCQERRSDVAEARAAERGLEITTVRVTPKERGSDFCPFPDTQIFSNLFNFDYPSWFDVERFLFIITFNVLLRFKLCCTYYHIFLPPYIYMYVCIYRFIYGKT